MIPIAIGIIQGQNRTQINLFPISPDQSIDPGNEVRIIDLFVDSLSIKDYGFRADIVENPEYSGSGIPSFGLAQTLHLRVSEQTAVIKGSGKRMRKKH